MKFPADKFEQPMHITARINKSVQDFDALVFKTTSGFAYNVYNMEDFDGEVTRISAGDLLEVRPPSRPYHPDEYAEHHREAKRLTDGGLSPSSLFS